MDRDNSFCFRCQSSGGRIDINIQGVGIDINEYRRGPHKSYRVRGRDEGEVGDNHFVSWSYSHCAQGKK